MYQVGVLFIMSQQQKDQHQLALIQTTLSKPVIEYVRIVRCWKYWHEKISTQIIEPITLHLQPYLTVYAEPSLGIAAVFDATYGVLYMRYYKSPHRTSLFNRFSRGEAITVNCVAGFIIDETKQ